ncbi:uncharacterized protein LOC131003951 [Salvia miltiorrhiza]|uniref:uncharacterized protein LOC131003951 n=1 Tax=Salvia miltiorrhiza TaxID=226208 RepID=UPI0025AD797E|nr:uncharacterized protein LOC131003951 [Salvia miltiorrhiza]XP_057786503.1 uncharacterized protein LOC131003951 [Salvia miltiorrhiza]
MYGFNSVTLLTGAAPYAKIRHSSHRCLAGISQIADRRKCERKKENKLKKLSSHVVMLTCQSSADTGVCNVYLVGADHSCPKSSAEVKAVAKFLKPEVFFLELCSDRTNALTREIDKVPTMREMIDMWKKNYQPTFILYKWFIPKVYPGEVPSDGRDFYAANEEAKKYGAKVILGDRPLDITLQRYRARTSLWQVHAFLYGQTTLCYDIYEETFVNERDLYMSAKILEVAQKHKSVVAVVGEDHLLGIQKNWKKPVDTEQLLYIPTGKKKVASIGAAVAIIYGIYFSMKN